MVVARWITLFVAAFTVVVPNIADWSATHIYHHDWTGHARLHTVWQLVMQTMFALYAISLVWRGKVSEAGLVNLIILAGFFVAGLLSAAGIFDGAYTDMTDGSTQIAGVDGNLLAFSILLFLQVFALARIKQASGN